MRDLLLQPRTTVQGLAAAGSGVTTITQDEEYWLDTTGITEVGALVECTSLTLPAGANISLVVETAPTPDENLFAPIAPAIVFDGTDVTASSSPIQFKTVRTPSTVAPAGLLRWKVSVSSGASGTWGLTFRIRVIPGRSRFFVPTDIAGNVGWYRADIGITKDASKKVSTWADQSGQAHDLTSSGANQPTWVASSINSRPGVSFDPTGAPQLMKTSSYTLGTYTILMVATGQDPAATIGWFWTRGPSGTVSDTLYGTTGSTIYSTRAGTTSARDLLPLWGRSFTAAVMTVLMDGTHAGHRLRINGVEQSMSVGTTGDPGTLSTSDPFSIAASSDAVLPSKTSIVEVIVYDRGLSTDELAIIEEYLRRRYALY